ncbi:PHP domain-containing protein [Peptostreptococcus equinus]|uniref:PHP domain-containing protein n=1 Tax=Peptostreptococcus equinus TaxID=3003601 RepID=A0ABY7JUE6_9FIRM|nr:PHP domain-containing protein [Peptostreptococcus sp. CBA3647]WAW15352.1 PHP domain-containing protein [Peptostreptococcus sp. CBA3647]
MKIIADYHTHTIFSCGKKDTRRHAKGTIEENIISAIEKGIETIGISEHGFDHYTYGLSNKNFEIEYNMIQEFREKYPQINILMGMECNILDDKGNIDMKKEYIDKFDYILAGYHFGTKIKGLKGLLHTMDNYIFGGVFSRKYNTKCIVNAMKKNKILYISHPGDKGRVDIMEIAKVAEQTGTGLEINGYHDRLSAEMIKKIKHMDINFYIGSDAHSPRKIGNFDLAYKIIEESGLDWNKVVNVKK